MNTTKTETRPAREAESRERACSYMEAQAVRIHLDGIMAGNYL